MSEYVEVTCPFCGEGGFDRCGLKYHFERGHCEVYERTNESNFNGDVIVIPKCIVCGDPMTPEESSWVCAKRYNVAQFPDHDFDPPF